jgi:hypothetical protein
MIARHGHPQHAAAGSGGPRSSRTPRMDRRGLGSSLSQSTPASAAAPCFIPASAAGTSAPMDTQPSHSSQPHSLTDPIAAMEVDPQPSHSITPMDCDEPPTLSADAITRAQFWSALHGVPSDLIEPIFCWFDSHTDFDTQQVRAAIVSLHAQQPGYLPVRPAAPG